MIGTGFLRQFLGHARLPGCTARPSPPLRVAPAGSGVEVPVRARGRRHLIARHGLARRPRAADVHRRLRPPGRRRRVRRSPAGDPRRRSGIPAAAVDRGGRRVRRRLASRSASVAFRCRRLRSGRSSSTTRRVCSGSSPTSGPIIAGISIQGILSHGFLRHYAWTLDFERHDDDVRRTRLVLRRAGEDLSHVDETGGVRMVDVGGKPVPRRRARRPRLRAHGAGDGRSASASCPKGDASPTAQVAGIMAAKRTAELIPLCHPLPLPTWT